MKLFALMTHEQQEELMRHIADATKAIVPPDVCFAVIIIPPGLEDVAYACNDRPENLANVLEAVLNRVVEKFGLVTKEAEEP